MFTKYMLKISKNIKKYDSKYIKIYVQEQKNPFYDKFTEITQKSFYNSNIK